MKLLGWMHRKLVQNCTEPRKNSNTGNPFACFSVQTSLNEQTFCIEPTKTLSHANIKCEKSSNKFEANIAEMLFREEFEPFDFLSIGTFGMELLNTDPPTPTLPSPSENFTNQQMEVTENDLKSINYEIEKFLEAEEKGKANETSGRSSLESIITLSHKPIEGDGHMVACPLQKYLFATSIELAETEVEIQKENISLGELFNRTDIVSDPIRKYEVAEKQGTRRNLAHFMKKVVKKFHSTPSSCTGASKNDAAVSFAVKKKLSKVIKMFHKKVHPEEMNDKEFIKLQNRMKNSSHEDGFQFEKDKEHKKFAQEASKNNKKCIMKLSSNGVSKGASNVQGRHGHWIKTDSNYLVLEL